MENSNDNRSGHIPCWTEPMDYMTTDDHCDISGQAVAGLASAISHLSETRVWNAVTSDRQAMTDILELNAALALLVAAIARGLARQ